MTERPNRYAIWAIVWVVALASFALGAWIFGNVTPPEPNEREIQSADGRETHWTCSMHPQIRKDEPGQCPICGMDLVPVEEGGSVDSENGARIVLSDRAKVLARVRTTEAGRLGSDRVARRLLGRVDYDETRLRTVTAWVGGRIDRLFVSTTGERVKRGQVIATLYSPEVYSAHQDLMQAKHQLERLQDGATASARRAAEAAFAAARDRLRLLGVPEHEIAAMERASKPSEQIRIRTPFAGTVIERLATQGSYVETGTGLYRIADLSKLWVQLDAYESDLAALRVGQDVVLRVDALPGETFHGKVTFVDPVLDPASRTARVRIEVNNRDRRLRPGMFVEASVQGAATRSDSEQSPLVIPASAPLFTGRRSIVYVEDPSADQPTYEARK